MHQNESRDYLWGGRNVEDTHSLIFLFYEFSKFYIISVFFSCRKHNNVYLLKSQQGKEHENIIALASLAFRPSDIFLLISLLSKAPRVNQIKD